MPTNSRRTEAAPLLLASLGEGARLLGEVARLTALAHTWTEAAVPPRPEVGSLKEAALPRRAELHLAGKPSEPGQKALRPLRRLPAPPLQSPPPLQSSPLQSPPLQSPLQR